MSRQDYYDDKVARTLLIAMWCMDSSVVPTSISCSVGDGGGWALDDITYPILGTILFTFPFLMYVHGLITIVFLGLHIITGSQ